MPPGARFELGRGQRIDAAGRALQHAFHVDDLFEAFQEQFRDHGQLVDLLQGDAAADKLEHREDAVRPEFGDVGLQFGVGIAVEFRHPEVADAGLQGAHGFQAALFEGGSDAHDFAGRFHLRAQRVGRVGELVEGEAGELDGRGAAGDGNVFQRHAHGDLRRDPRNGVAAGFAGEGGGTGHSGVDFDQEILGGVGVKGELHVAAAFDLQLLDDLDGRVVQHLQIVVV